MQNQIALRLRFHGAFNISYNHCFRFTHFNLLLFSHLADAFYPKGPAVNTDNYHLGADQGG